MIGDNLPLQLAPGLNADVSRYAAGMSWWDGNLVRWNEEGVLGPVGGWQKLYDATVHTEPIREAFSWTDNSNQAFKALGSLDVATVRKNSDGTVYDVTPSDLVSVASGATGYGSGSFGSGRFGLDSSNNSGGGSDNKFDVGYWTFDNFGEDLIAVHSNDGRLFSWSPSSPTGDLTAVTNAPTGNRLCITTDERHVMVMGGTNPRRVKWCSREAITVWTAAADNSAGGWDLDTSGEIIAAIKVPQGILVATDVDMHLIEYIGPPNYYSRRLISDETGIIGPKAMAPIPNGAVIFGSSAFWEFNGGLTKIFCTVSDNVFKKGNLNTPLACFAGINEPNQEIWFFYPASGEVEASRYVSYRYASGQQWWSKGIVSRTAWLNPVWGTKPIGINNLAVYEHERGWTDNGTARNVYAETGALEIKDGTDNITVKQIYHDTILPTDYQSGDPLPYTVEFKLARAPQGAETIYGPVTLNVSAGYTALRFKTKQFAMKIQEVVANDWGFGKARLKVKAVGKR